ncbi:hypothetical protein BX600DRAFT_387632 [Xylariales sp. PMI_506]|nr:hypothetical protein BX600DRAFT_387632 [Xylariales sp. PMI_506]
MNSFANQLQQIHLGFGDHGFELITHHEVENELYVQEHTKIQASLLRKCPAHLWYNGSYKAACPRPILITEHHEQLLQSLHDALTSAITDIVQRWWIDADAQFPTRMPLEKEEEELLQWIEDQVSCGKMPKFSTRLGSWRPDFLVEDIQSNNDGVFMENFRITEINARFSFNGFMHEAYGQQALDDLGAGVKGLVSATDPEMVGRTLSHTLHHATSSNVKQILDGLFSLFQENLPLHLLKGEEKGIDIHMFVDAVQSRFGVTPRLVHPADLRLLPDSQSPGGFKLYCINKDLAVDEEEVLEEVYQIGLELHQHELVALGSDMVRQISLRCFNDMRTILLVHDKRMLGIVKQELDSLVARHVITAGQARILDLGIADTYLPGSQDLRKLLRDSEISPDVRNSFILKPIRGGKGVGIVFGDELDLDEWLTALRHLQVPKLTAGGRTCVVQRRIFPRLYDLILQESGERLRYPLVGTYHVTNGKLSGLGTWRSSASRICAVSCGGAWICSVVRRD